MPGLVGHRYKTDMTDTDPGDKAESIAARRKRLCPFRLEMPAFPVSLRSNRVGVSRLESTVCDL